MITLNTMILWYLSHSCLSFLACFHHFFFVSLENNLFVVFAFYWLGCNRLFCDNEWFMLSLWMMSFFFLSPILDYVSGNGLFYFHFLPPFLQILFSLFNYHVLTNNYTRMLLFMHSRKGNLHSGISCWKISNTHLILWIELPFIQNNVLF